MEFKTLWFQPGCFIKEGVPRRFLTSLLFSLLFFASSAQTVTGKFSLSFSNAPIENVFKEIRKQSGYSFIYTQEQLKTALPVTVNLKDVTLEAALAACFRGQPFTFIVEGKQIAVKEKEANAASVATPHINISGLVRDDKGDPVSGSTVTIKRSGRATSTDGTGYFELKNVEAYDALVITGVGFQTREIAVANRTSFDITLPVLVGELDEAVVIAYGTTTKRLNTGNVGRVTSKEIENQPVSNPLSALQGRVAGLLITQSSGVPGSAFKVQIQGQQSLGARGGTILVSNEPLFIIDGVPFAAGNTAANQLSSAAGNPADGLGLSPLNLINPADIESIEVLKDADATAIYGSRGANGVILITTKKGKSGQVHFSGNVYTGYSRVTKTTKMLNTQQYVEMRREGITNDGATLNGTAGSPGFAPDLLFWDTTKYTDWRKEFIGGTARTTDAQGAFSGGNANTQFLIGGGYHRETTVYPGDMKDNRGSARFNLNHSSTNRKLTITLSGSYAVDVNRLNSMDLTNYINIPPNLPGFIDNQGNFKWEHNTVRYSSIGVGNPMAEIAKAYRADSKSLLSNLGLGYQIARGLVVRTSVGYNNLSVDEVKLVPKSAGNPAVVTTGSSQFGNRTLTSWIIEPQVEYNRILNKSRVNILAGTTFQNIVGRSQFLSGTGYTNDQLLQSIAAAATVRGSNDNSQYRYTAVFGRVTYNIANTYLINLSGRRDGSSRFGSGHQFANFGAAGLAWIFTEHAWMKTFFPALNFGKIKLSYGLTGNDQIGDYRFLPAWTTSTDTYQGASALVPARLANPDYSWERNRKLQGGLELGLFKERIFFSVMYYRNRSDNQLVSYPLPIQTGFSNLGAKNIPALIENKGWEFVLNVRAIRHKYFSWTTSGNLTRSRNKLLKYPGLEGSSYATNYVVGQSLNVIYRYDFLGVDPLTGIYQFRDVNNDGVYNTKDYVVSGTLDPSYYGGWSNSFNWKNLEASFLVEFRKQKGADYRSNITQSAGYFVNQPVSVLDRWRKPGDLTDIQKYSATSSTVAFSMMTRFASSNAAYSDASFARLKNVALSYKITSLARWKIESIRIYALAQNLLTITGYRGSDPENQSLYRLPPLRTITAGLQFNL